MKTEEDRKQELKTDLKTRNVTSFQSQNRIIPAQVSNKAHSPIYFEAAGQ